MEGTEFYRRRYRSFKTNDFQFSNKVEKVFWSDLTLIFEGESIFISKMLIRYGQINI